MQDKRKKKWIGVGSGVLLIVLGILLNIVPNKLVGVFGLPLFLDCIGTILVAMLGGVFPAVLVGFTTNLVKSFLVAILFLIFGLSLASSSTLKDNNA